MKAYDAIHSIITGHVPAEPEPKVEAEAAPLLVKHVVVDQDGVEQRVTKREIVIIGEGGHPHTMLVDQAKWDFSQCPKDDLGRPVLDPRNTFRGGGWFSPPPGAHSIQVEPIGKGGHGGGYTASVRLDLVGEPVFAVGGLIEGPASAIVGESPSETVVPHALIEKWRQCLEKRVLDLILPPEWDRPTSSFGRGGSYRVETDFARPSEVCPECEGGGWMYSSFQAHGAPNFEICDTCLNPENHPCP